MAMHVPILLWQCMYPSFYGNACTHPFMAMHVPILLWQCMYPSFYGNACTQPSMAMHVPSLLPTGLVKHVYVFLLSKSTKAKRHAAYITRHAALHHPPCSPTSHSMQPYITYHSPAALHHTPALQPYITHHMSAHNRGKAAEPWASSPELLPPPPSFPLCFVAG